MRTEVLHINRIGQVPGQVYAAQVIDEQGKGLYAGWFFMDANGKQITSDLLTANDGSFHFTVPDYNHDSIFVQFYATAEYEPTVKTFTELVENPVVVLKKDDNDSTNTGPSLQTVLSLAGLTVALISLNQKRSMGNVAIQRFKAQPKGQKALMIGGAIFLVWYLLKYKPTPEQDKELANAKKMLDILAQQYGIVPSLSLAQFSSLVAVIVKSVDKCGTDEQSIYRSFETLNNEADIYQLIVSYGIAKYDGCFEGSLPFWTVHYTLSQSMASDLDNTEVEKINSILAGKGISYRF